MIYPLPLFLPSSPPSLPLFFSPFFSPSPLSSLPFFLLRFFPRYSLTLWFVAHYVAQTSFEIMAILLTQSPKLNSGHCQTTTLEQAIWTFTDPNFKGEGHLLPELTLKFCEFNRGSEGFIHNF